MPMPELYLVVAGGDGFQSEIVTADKLDEAFLAAHFGSAEDADKAERDVLLGHLHVADNWICDDAMRLRLRINYEDGYVEVIRITDAHVDAARALARAVAA